MNTGEKAICLEDDKAIKLCKEIKIRPGLDLYIHPTFEETSCSGPLLFRYFGKIFTFGRMKFVTYIGQQPYQE